MPHLVNIGLLSGVVAAAVLSSTPAHAESAGLSLESNRQGKGAKIAWTSGANPHLHMESQTGGRAWGFTRGIFSTPAEALGLITYTLHSQCTDATSGGRAEVFVRFHDSNDVMYGRYYPCDVTVGRGETQTVDPSAFRAELEARQLPGLVVSAVDFVVRDRAAADFDDMTVTYSGGTAVFHDSVSAAATVKSRR